MLLTRRRNMTNDLADLRQFPQLQSTGELKITSNSIIGEKEITPVRGESRLQSTLT